jgi:hypothetical protein
MRNELLEPSWLGEGCDAQAARPDVPAIHAFLRRQGVDARDKPGHDAERARFHHEHRSWVSARDTT